MLGGLGGFALAWSWRGGCYVLGLGFARVPTQHPASSAFADAFPGARISPGSVQGQPTMGRYPPIPSQHYPGDHTLQKPSPVFPPSQTSKPGPGCLQAPSSTRCLPPAPCPGLGSVPRARGSGSPLPARSPAPLLVPQQKQIFQIFLAAPCFPLLSCNKGSKMFFPLGTSSGIN